MALYSFQILPYRLAGAAALPRRNRDNVEESYNATAVTCKSFSQNRLPDEVPMCLTR